MSVLTAGYGVLKTTNRPVWMTSSPHWLSPRWPVYTVRAVPGLPTIEFPAKYERPLRQIAMLQDKMHDCQTEIKNYEKEIEAHSVRIAEIMCEHEHGILNAGTDKLLIDFVTKTTRRPDSKALKEKYPAAYADVLKVSESRRLRVRIEKG